MTKVPPFISYDYCPQNVAQVGSETRFRKPSIRALAKDGTIWETFLRNDDTWAPWQQIK